MIFKFCFENEIHRCTHPPMTYEALKPFLLSMFKIGFPTNPVFHFLDENNDKVLINSEEDYQQLLSMELSGSIKIFITSQDIKSESSDRISESEIIEDIEFHSDMSEKSPYEVLEVPQANENLVYESAVKIQQVIIQEVEVKSEEGSKEFELDSIEEVKEAETDEDEIVDEKVIQEEIMRKIIKEEIIHEESEKEEVIIENITKEKEEIITEEKFGRQEPSTLEDIIMSTAESRVYESVKDTYEIVEDQDTRLREIVKETLTKEMPNILLEIQSQILYRELIDKSTQCYCTECQGTQEQVIIKEKVKPPGFFDKLRKLGQFLKEQILEIPEATLYLLDDISQMLDGDPNLLYKGGKYPKSVIQKSKKIKELFPNADLKYTLNFVSRLPKAMTVDEIVETYINHELPQEVAQ